MRNCITIVCALAATVGYAPAGLWAAEGDSRGIAHFESKIRPVLVAHCYKCHSADTKAEAGLTLDSRDGIRTGGDRGPAVVPGDAANSVLLIAISHSDPELTMPPKVPRLADSVIKDFEAWIKMGAPDPREPVAAARLPQVDIEKGRSFWAFQKPVEHPLPTVMDGAWARRDLDRFILARLEGAGIAPSPDALPHVLLRRLHFDLLGLPPTPEAIAKFLERIEEQGLEAALSAEVDTLLASPHFGERWGRHWLDVARFAESSGKESNLSFPHAWRYRNYVIDSVATDKPYDRFLTEQIAGDLLPFDSPEQRAELLTATGFLAIGPKGLNEMNPRQFAADVADEQVDAVTQAVMATTVACARCHDHKFDPFTMEDYYALAGIFTSTKTCFGTSVGPQNQVGGDLLVLPNYPGHVIPNQPFPAERVAKLKAELAALNREEAEGRAAIAAAMKRGEDPTNLFTLQNALRIIWRRGAIEGQLKTVEITGRALPLAMGVSDREKTSDAPLLERGEISRPTKPVPRGFPQVIEVANMPSVPADQSGRLELARWLAQPDHPLTARVMANRIWHHLFGAGMVRTVDNFGANGERPSHPELLDYLAMHFVKEGWSTKSLIREIVLSRTYRQSSAYREDAFQQDPDDRLLWRANKRRLDAEAIRDAMLFVSGRLDTARPEASLVAQLGDKSISILGFDKRVPADLDGSRHRSVYLPVLRDRLPDVLDLFDFAEPSLVTGARDTTNVPSQALYLMNSPFVREQSQALAKRLSKEETTGDDRVSRAFLLCYGREPDAAEGAVARDFFGSGSGETNSNSDEQTLANYCQALLSTAEFRNLD